MYRSMMIALLAAFCLVNFGGSQEKGDNKLATDFTQLHVVWKVTWKRCSMENKDGFSHITLVLEHDKDFTDSERTLFRKMLADGTDSRISAGFTVMYDNFYQFFDEENVSVGKVSVSMGTIDGDITGAKGDAFRVLLKVPAKLTEKVKKIAWRSDVHTEAKAEKLAIDRNVIEFFGDRDKEESAVVQVTKGKASKVEFPNGFDAKIDGNKINIVAFKGTGDGEYQLTIRDDNKSSITVRLVLKRKEFKSDKK
jgi:hypothetical protein